MVCAASHLVSLASYDDLRSVEMLSSIIVNDSQLFENHSLQSSALLKSQESNTKSLLSVFMVSISAGRSTT